MAKAPKIDRKELKRPDEFQTSGTKLMEKLYQKRQSLLPLLIAVLLGGVFVYGYSWWQEGRLNEAWTEYAKADGKKEEEKWSALESFYEKFRSFRPGQMAAIQLADHYFDERSEALIKDPKSAVGTKQKPNDAHFWYSNALKFGELRVQERQLLHVNLGKALELEGNRDDALKEYQKAAELGSELKGFAMLQVGRIFEEKGDTAQAASTYEQVSKEFLDTEYARLAKLYLRALKSPLLKLQGKKG